MTQRSASDNALSLPMGAIVLCGGKSSRMGTSKAWLPFGDETMLQRVVRVVATVAKPVVVVAAEDQELPEVSECVTILRDEMPEQGPLQGLLMGLTHLQDRVEFAFVTGCDTPFLEARFIQQMRELAIDNGVTVPQIGGRTHPLASVIAVSLLPRLTSLFKMGERRMTALFEQLPTQYVTEAQLTDSGLSSLCNINTAGEYQQALADIADVSS